VATLLALRQAGEALVQKELLLLQAQIKPHFIYNSISVIASLSTRDPQRAKELLLSFADYLRGSFRFEDRQGMIPLKEELITVGAYLELEQARFKHRLSVVWDVEEGLDCLLPVLVIQPLVENAVFHGVRSNPDKKGTVTLRIWRQGEWIHVEVIDDGRGMDAETVAQIMQGSSSGTGLALKNINQRLQKIYGRGLLIESSPSVGTKVVMELPTCLEGSGSDAGNGG